MILKNASLQEFDNYIKESGKDIVLFGAGTLLISWMPYVLEHYGMIDSVKLIIDNSPEKWGEEISVGGRNFLIGNPEMLCQKITSRMILMITSSYFAKMIEQFDRMPELDSIECFVAPIMYLTHRKEKRSEFRPFMREQMSIPKVIHYCWFGRNPIPEKNRRCIESWKRYCPDYEIVEWNENNYDIYKNEYMGQAYDAKKYGYVPDYARIDILYSQGGIYFDTDVELIRNIDDLLYLDAFTSFEEYPTVNFGGGSGSVKGLPVLKRILDFREKAQFLKRDGSYNTITCGYYETFPLRAAGLRQDGTLQNIEGLTVLSSDYFHPKSSVSGCVNQTENTYAIHQFSWSWVDDRQKEEKRKTQEKYREIIKRMQG